jgi:hypothetical protein
MELFKKIEKAIKSINPNAHYIIRENNLDMIEWEDDTTPISKTEIENKILTIEDEIAQAETDKQNKKASGKQKLKDLGLDDDEIQALIGV